MEYSEKVLVLIDKYITGDITENEQIELDQLIREMPELEQEIIEQDQTLNLLKESVKEYEKLVSKKIMINPDLLSEQEYKFLDSRRGNPRFENRLKLYEKTLKRIENRKVQEESVYSQFSILFKLPTPEQIHDAVNEFYQKLSSLLLLDDILIVDPDSTMSPNNKKLSSQIDIEGPKNNKMEMIEPIIDCFKNSMMSELAVYFGTSGRISLTFDQEDNKEEIMEQLQEMYSSSMINKIEMR